MSRLLKEREPIIPNDKDIEIAKESSRTLAGLLHKKTKNFDILLGDPKGSKRIIIPNSVLKMLLTILTQMSKGNAVTIIPLHTELTTQEAANLLNVSRPFLISVLEDGKIPYRMVGTRRKILFEDLIAYKESMNRARLKTLDALTKDAQDQDMGY